VKKGKIMKATLMYKSGDVRVQDVPDPVIEEPSDAVIRVTYACVCGSDLHPYHDLEETPEGRRMGHEAIGVVEQVGEQVSTPRASQKQAAVGRRSCSRRPTATASHYRNPRRRGQQFLDTLSDSRDDHD
jgi:threonine dehydrogenase-like Zn-dependent dehydrogenase